MAQGIFNPPKKGTPTKGRTPTAQPRAPQSQPQPTSTQNEQLKRAYEAVKKQLEEANAKVQQLSTQLQQADTQIQRLKENNQKLSQKLNQLLKKPANKEEPADKEKVETFTGFTERELRLMSQLTPKKLVKYVEELKIKDRPMRSVSHPVMKRRMDLIFGNAWRTDLLELREVRGQGGQVIGWLAVVEAKVFARNPDGSVNYNVVRDKSLGSKFQPFGRNRVQQTSGPDIARIFAEKKALSKWVCSDVYTENYESLIDSSPEAERLKSKEYAMEFLGIKNRKALEFYSAKAVEEVAGEYGDEYEESHPQPEQPYGDLGRFGGR